ncbi:hypothetical protein [Sporolactobacillus nakayamae]|uniref:Photosynthesis system II assembly factor Ycf48/Hcf136-like domain-containing protein n=1 Tax=Sporolactobacillus nakayamae TaxID=269670 RepID=A0A1I2SL50_9BACL|nr:hypothetical protein [Sporolactobacillus nakayamae]SFG53412.1 hypothetical protein SAMN02982927_01986 [Sporolactobacillus nakayamae]
MNETKKQASGKTSVRWVFWLLAAKIAFILLLAGVTVWIIYAVQAHNSGSSEGVRFTHVLGAGYSKDGKTVWLGTDKQLVTYKKGTWDAENLKSDSRVLMYLPINSGFIQISKSGSIEWKTLKQEPLNRRKLNDQKGLWAQGYATGRLYNLHTIGKTSELRFSDNRGDSWRTIKLETVEGTAQVLAVSPTNKSQLAIGTTKGLYVSTDHGAHFQRYLKGHSVTSMAYGFTKQSSLLVASFRQETSLYQILPQQTKTINLDMDTVASDRLIKIIQNPIKPGEAIILTKHGDMYQTENGGQNWTIIAQKGRGLNGN